MDFPTTRSPATVRRDGWTAERRAQFLERLAGDGNVLAACAFVGLTRPTAYRLRLRDPAFARDWAAAQSQAHAARMREPRTCAIDGIAVEVRYRGKVVGTRRRYDTRLLLAHLARLDKAVAANPQAEADAARFDELLARLACGCGPAQAQARAEPDFSPGTVSRLYTSPAE